MKNINIFQRLINVLPRRRRQLHQAQVNAQVENLIKTMQTTSPHKLACCCRGLLPGQPSRCQ
jgi:hypothetical protein